jgi:hypothetical protein
MKIFKTFSSIKTYNQEVHEYYLRIQARIMDEGEPLSDSVSECFGGDICLIETFQELDAVKTVVNKDDHSYYSILEMPSHFDVCEYIIDKKFVEIFLATNNGGGNDYLIPAAIAESCPNVIKSIELTNEDHS